MGRETAATGAVLEVLIVAASQGNSFRRRFSVRGVNGRENAVASKHQDDTGGERQRAHNHVRNGDCYISGRGLNCIARGENGPIGHSAEDELNTKKNFEVARGAAQVFHFAKPPSHGEDGPKDHSGDDDRADNVRNNPEGIMAERGAEDDLQQNQNGSPHSERVQTGGAAICELRQGAQPPAAGENSEADYGDEKQFGKGCVGGRNRGRQKEFYGDAAENTLSHDKRQGGPSQIPHPGTRFPAPRPDGENDGENADESGDHAMAVLVHDSADHGRPQRTVGKRPIGDGQASVIAGDEGARDQQQKCASGREDGEAVKSAIASFSQRVLIPFRETQIQSIPQGLKSPPRRARGKTHPSRPLFKAGAQDGAPAKSRSRNPTLRKKKRSGWGTRKSKNRIATKRKP